MGAVTDGVKDPVEWVWVDLPYACAAVMVTDGTIVDAAPIFRWAVGGRLDQFLSWAKSKRGKVRGE